MRRENKDGFFRRGSRVKDATLGPGVIIGFSHQGAPRVQFESGRTEYRFFDSLESLDELERKQQKERSEAEERMRQKQRAAALAEKRAEAIVNIRICISGDFLAADLLYRERFSDVLNEAEYTALKHEFVRAWLQGNLTIFPGRVPDDEQIAAIAAVTGTIQVIARTGSGKTTTLIQRAYFLMRHCKVPPEQILLLAFNRSAVLKVRRELLAILCPATEATVTKEIRAKKQSIRKRLDREVAAVDSAARIHDVAMPSVMTFHALAYGLVNPAESVLKDSEEDGDFGLSRAMQRVIDDHLRDKAWLPRIRSLMLAHFRNDWERIEHGGFDLQDRTALLEHRRSLPRETLQGEYVKSYGEKVIANFLFEHGVPYKYERNHRWSGINYRPDFTLFRQAGKIPVEPSSSISDCKESRTTTSSRSESGSIGLKSRNGTFSSFRPRTSRGKALQRFALGFERPLFPWAFRAYRSRKTNSGRR